MDSQDLLDDDQESEPCLLFIKVSAFVIEDQLLLSLAGFIQEIKLPFCTQIFKEQ